LSDLACPNHACSTLYTITLVLVTCPTLQVASEIKNVDFQKRGNNFVYRTCIVYVVLWGAETNYFTVITSWFLFISKINPERHFKTTPSPRRAPSWLARWCRTGTSGWAVRRNEFKNFNLSKVVLALWESRCVGGLEIGTAQCILYTVQHVARMGLSGISVLCANVR